MVRGSVIQEGMLVYESDHRARVAFEVATRKRYFDHTPIAEQHQSELLGRVHRRSILNG